MHERFMESMVRCGTTRSVGRISHAERLPLFRIRFGASMASIVRFFAALVLASVVLASQTTAAPRIESVDRPTVSIYFFDVGQGDAALVQTADGKSLLLDAGPVDSASRLATKLAALGITQLDAFVLTHPHADHIGGALALVKRFPPKVVLDPGFSHPSTVYAEFLEYVEKSGISYRQPRKGLAVKLGVHAKFDVLAPEDPFLSGTRSDANSNSVVMTLRVGDVSVMLTGDAEAETERRVLRAADATALDVDVLKVAHHGSAHSSTSAFLGYVKPEVAVISCGASNRYGHPAPEAIHRLSAAGAEIFVTAKLGDIVVHTDGTNYSVDTITFGAQEVTAVVLPGMGQGAAAAAANAPAGPPAGTAALPVLSDHAQGLDINAAGQEDFETLPGIGPAKARAIMQQRESRGGFASVEDLREVKGIGAKTFEQLRPLVHVGPRPSPGTNADVAAAPHRETAEVAVGASSSQSPVLRGIDLNSATMDDLLGLPGIGRVKADAIFQYRAQIGGFSSVEQLAEVKGIGPKTLSALRPLVHVGAQTNRVDSVPAGTPNQPATSGTLVDLNTATEGDLCTLPGIGPAKASAIVKYRNSAGRFNSVEQLGEVRGIGQKTLDQLRPLVTVGQPSP